ncbi:radical SAM family heme chaperone HemW [Flavobacteriales bacterium]|jgi:oxygen-independent coproporphyrinogen III oxidase|nr:radical SAM family heme chaperone HemW [Flavobacteriales bacterium]
MAGVYIHIPFCKQACHYCNFYFSTTFEKYRSELVAALVQEMKLKSLLFKGKEVETIYFGGGTPSLLIEEEFRTIFNGLKESFNIGKVEEVTIEANPDDVTVENLAIWQSYGINRISLGVQSFFEDDLEQMNRSHSSKQAHNAIKRIKESGIDNYSVDFMFALPLLSNEQLEKNLQIAIDYKVPHVSCYNLTIKEQTALMALIKKGKIEDLSEEKSIQQFKIVMNRLGSNRYHQYEISNYALEGYQSKHNSSYWYQKPYLGIGPSAHSFYESKRTFNISSISKYIKLLGEGKDYFEVEELTEKEFFNEFIMTRLRTSKGLDRRDLEIIFPKFVDAFKEKTSNYLRGGQLAFFGDEYRLTPEGKLMADYITSEFFEV